MAGEELTIDSDTAKYLDGGGRKPRRKKKPTAKTTVVDVDAVVTDLSDGESAAREAERKARKKAAALLPAGAVQAEHPVCVRCGLFKKAMSPFLLPSYWSPEKDDWVLGWPKSDKASDNPKSWIVVLGELPDSDADSRGDIRHDRGFKWMQTIAEAYPEERDRILYLPSLLCRPNDPEKNEAIPCQAILKMTRVQSMTCGTRHLLPKVHADYKVDRLVGVGWIGSLVTVNNMGIDHVAGKLYRNKSYRTLCTPIRGTDHIAFDPSSKERTDTVIANWEWALTFEVSKNVKCPWSWYVTGEALAEWSEGLELLPEKKRILYLDVETNGVDVFKKGFVIGMFSLYYKGAKEVAIVPITLKSAPALFARIAGGGSIRGWPEALKGLLKVLFRLVRSKLIKKVGHNLGYDVNAIRKYLGWQMRGVYLDTMYLHYCVDPDNHGMKGLDELLREYAPEIPDYWDEMDRYRADNNIDNFLDVPAEMLAEYAAFDTFILDRIKNRIIRRLKASPGGEFVTSEGPVRSVSLNTYAVHGRSCHLRLCTHLDFVGQKVDDGMARKVKSLLMAKINSYRRELAIMPQIVDFETNILGAIASKSSPQYKVYKMGEKPSINWGSLAQQRALLIDHLGLPIVATTDSGLAKLDEPVLQQYATDYSSQVCVQLMKIRESEKFVTSFLDPMIEDKKLVIHDDGLVHASFRGCWVSTGRLSAARPNITALPRLGSIKHLYVSRHKNGWIVTRDYSGIEVRVMAMLSGCPVLLKILRDGGDVHFYTQTFFFKGAANAKDKTQRSICKQTLFGNLYGQGDQGLFDLLRAARVLSPTTGLPITMEECHDFNQMLYEAYPGVGKWVQQAHLYGIMNQCTGSGFGFVRQLPALASWRFSKQVKRVMDYEDIKKHPDYRKLTSSVSKDLRRAQNAPIQSTAGDLTSFAALRIQETFENDGYDVDQAAVFSIVHDDIWVDVRDTETVPYVLGVMETVMDHPSAWIGEVLPGIDASWLDLVPIFGECELGISPKDAVPGKMNGGVLEVQLDVKDFELLWPAGSNPISSDLKDDGSGIVTVDFLDAAEKIRPLLHDRRNMKLLSL